MKVKCSVCGKITAGRLPRRTRHDIGDGTFWYPRRHKCVGDIQEGLLVDEHLLTKRAADVCPKCLGKKVFRTQFETVNCSRCNGTGTKGGENEFEYVI